MMMTKKMLPRRTVLRGLGSALALPLLDAMVPALVPLAKGAGQPVKRFGVVYVDYATQSRTMKRSGHWYASVTRDNGIPE